MPYEFDLFDKIIYDESRSFVIQGRNLTIYQEALKKKQDPCYNVIVANFKKGNKGLVLNNKREICSLHPEIESINKLQLSLFQNDISEVIDKKALKSLKIKETDILNYSFIKGAQGPTLYVKVKGTCETFDALTAKYYYYNSLLKTEVIRIKKSITDQVFQFKASEEIEQYIHIQQQALIQICFRLIKILDPDKNHDIYKSSGEIKETAILYLTYIALEDILRFIETSFLKYIDKNIQIPFRSALIKTYRINEKLELVKESLLSSEIDQELIQIIYAPFSQLSDITLQERITYRELLYFNSFLTAFYEEIKEAGTISQSQAIHLLHEFNFNCTSLIDYKISLIKEHIGKLEAYSRQVDYLYHCLKIANQRRCKLNMAYIPDLPSLKEQLVTWIEEEINYLAKKVNLSSKPHDLFNQENLSNVKIESGVSVSQLSYFFRLVSEVGIINHSNQSDIIRFVADSFQTPKTKDISMDSVRNKFYNVDDATISALKDFTIKILNKLKN